MFSNSPRQLALSNFHDNVVSWFYNQSNKTWNMFKEHFSTPIKNPNGSQISKTTSLFTLISFKIPPTQKKSETYQKIALFAILFIQKKKQKSDRNLAARMGGLICQACELVEESTNARPGSLNSYEDRGRGQPLEAFEQPGDSPIDRAMDGKSNTELLWNLEDF